MSSVAPRRLDGCSGGDAGIQHDRAESSFGGPSAKCDRGPSGCDPLHVFPTRVDILLRRAHQLATGLFTRSFAEFALTAPQHGALTVLAQKGELSQAAIGRALGYDRATTGELVRRLAARGLVRRTSADSGGNRHGIVLTEAGATLLRRSETVLERTMRQLVSPLNSDEQHALVSLLAKLARHGSAGFRATDMLEEGVVGSGNVSASEAPPYQATPAGRSDSDRAALPLEQRITFRFSRLAALSTRPVARLFLRRHGLTIPAWRALITIGSLQPTSPTEVARRMSIEADRVTRTVDRLVAKRLVRRENDIRDGRRSVLALTSRGQEVYTEIDRIRRAVESELLGVLSEHEVQIFQGYMDRIDAHGRRIFVDDRYWDELFAPPKSSRKLP